MIVSTTDNDNTNKKFSIQYTKKELDVIQDNFVKQMSRYLTKVNNNNNNRNNEVEIVPPTNSN